MKKSLYLFLAALVIISLTLVACSSPTTTPATTTPATKPPVSTTVAPPPTSAPAAPPSPSASVIVPPPLQTSTPTASSGAPQAGGTLRVIMFGSPLYLGDPTLMLDSNSGMAGIPSLEALVVSDNSGQIHPVLATSWTVAPDGKSITFNLRKGVKFHDGTDFNATAAKWNMDRYYGSQSRHCASLGQHRYSR